MKNKKIGKLFTPLMIISFVFLVIIIFATLFGKYIAPYNPETTDLANSFQKPSGEHWFGTDDLGRDLFSRILVGAHSTVLNAVLVVLIETLIGIPLGVMCGYFEGWFDNILMRIVDVLLAFPALILAFVLVAVMGRGEMAAVIACSLIFVAMSVRLTRSLALTEKTKTYVEAFKSLGYSNSRIVFLHVLPNCIPPVLSELTLDIGYAMINLASLSYLGMGVQAPKADWGSILENGMALLLKEPAIALIPGIFIICTVVAINTISDGIQMYLDPSQRKLPSFKKYRKKRMKYEQYGGN